MKMDEPRVETRARIENRIRHEMDDGNGSAALCCRYLCKKRKKYIFFFNLKTHTYISLIILFFHFFIFLINQIILILLYSFVSLHTYHLPWLRQILRIFLAQKSSLNKFRIIIISNRYYYYYYYCHYFAFYRHDNVPLLPAVLHGNLRTSCKWQRWQGGGDE